MGIFDARPSPRAWGRIWLWEDHLDQNVLTPREEAAWVGSDWERHGGSFQRTALPRFKGTGVRRSGKGDRGGEADETDGLAVEGAAALRGVLSGPPTSLPQKSIDVS